MRVLAIETSGRFGGVALAAAGEVRYRNVFAEPFVHSRALAPAIDEGLRSLNWRPGDVDVIGVSRGPGSYTGLRIGAAAGKTMAHAVGARLVGVPTLEAMARNGLRLPAGAGRLAPVMDARMGKLYACVFERRGDALVRRTEDRVVVPADLWRLVEPPAVVFGDGVPDGALPDGVVRGDAALAAADPAHVAVLATEIARDGRFEDVHAFAPVYLRRSAAEEKRKPAAAGTGVA
jgi:tRNA threonylcarbamoyladenosine biosynthesis protein TsaB